MINRNKSRLIKRQKRIRRAILETKKYPRLSVYKSNKHIYAQVIDDIKERTLVSVSDKALSKKEKPASNFTKVQTAMAVGEELAKKSLKKNVSQVVFDRGGYRYHGRVKALAEGARKGGMKF